jgi:hypothetical protein
LEKQKNGKTEKRKNGKTEKRNFQNYSYTQSDSKKDSTSNLHYTGREEIIMLQ